MIRLSDDREKVTVSYKGKEQIQLSVKRQLSLSDKHNYRWTVQKPRQLDESYMKGFAKDHCKLVQRLIFSIVSDESIDSDALRVLVEDNTFRETLEDVKIRFDQRYNRLDSIIKTLQRGRP